MDKKADSALISTLLSVGILFMLVLPLVSSVQQRGNPRYFTTFSGESTLVSGLISENATWTLEGSPYIVTEDVLVQSGVFLTIDPGVIVKFTPETSLIVDGVLVAHGNSTHRITFTSNSTTPILGDWKAINVRITGFYPKVEWVTVEYSVNGIKNLSNSNITHSTFRRNNIGVNGSSLIVRESNFTGNNIGVTGSDININLCRFEENDWGTNGKDVFIAGSKFVANNIGVDGSNLVLEESNFTGNNIGVTGSDININLCRFEQNDEGIGESYGLIARNSDFHNNTKGMTTIGGKILDCRVTRNKATGIHMLYGGEIRNTEVTHNGRDGILGEGWDRPIVANCLVTNNNGTGVSCDRINYSTVCDNEGNGVFLQGSMLHCIVSNNSRAGVSGRGTILNSQISNNLYGLEIGPYIYSGGNGPPAGHFDVIRSHIWDNELGGIVAGPEFFSLGPMESRVVNTIISDNGKYGIRTNTTLNDYDNPPQEAFLHIAEIANSVISNHSIGLQCSLGMVSHSNISSSSEIGLDIYGGPTNISFSNIHNNGQYSIRNNIPFGSDIHATNNWWGTSNKTLIGELIRDYYDDNSFSRVLYEPYMNSSLVVDTDKWIVDDDGPAHFDTIQGAITAARNGDTVLVKSGIYHEHITIQDKSLTLLGENRSAIVDGNGTGQVIWVWSTSERNPIYNFVISGFTVRNGDVGIRFDAGGDGGALYNFTISDNNVKNCSVGIRMPSKSIGYGWVVVNNSILINNVGVEAEYSGAGIIGNHFSGNEIGISTYGTTATIAKNYIQDGNMGINLRVDMKGGWNCDIVANHITRNIHGIYLYNGETGTSAGTISDNIINENNYGVYISAPYDQILTNCTLYHNNLINNTCQVYADAVTSSLVKWDAGYPIGGNHWSDYVGIDEHSGINQNEPNPDGIGDTSRTIDENNQDDYPLMRPFDQSLEIPVSSFVLNQTRPVINETVLFNASSSYDLDGYIISYQWDFGDGTSSTETTPIITHAYKTAGSYEVLLAVADNSSLADTVARTLTVEKFSSVISIFCHPTELVIRESTIVNGSIFPTRVGVDVTIWQRHIPEVDWIVLTNVTTEENGEYFYLWTPSEPGTYELKASWAGDNYTLSAETPTVTLTCLKVETSVLISTSCASTYIGFRVNVSGTLSDIYENALENETVVLYYTFRGITTWTPITSDHTDSQGKYFAVWIPPATGYILLKAEWAGNATHSEVQNTTTLSSLPYQNQFVFTVESNSTISELAFDTTDWTLGFEATGPNRTMGYVKATVAKSLVNNIANIRVYVDDNQMTDFSVTSTDDSWLLTFNYEHSTHQISVDLDTNIISEYSSFLILSLFIIATATAVIAYRRNHCST